MPLNPTPPAHRWRQALRLGLLLAAILGFVLLTGVLDGGVGVVPSRLLDQPRFVFANAWPGLLLAGVLLMATRRLLLSFGLVFLLQGVLYGVNALKVANLGTPLLPADFQMVGQLSKGGLHLLSGYLPHSPWPYLALLGGLALVVALWRLEPPLLPRRIGGRRWVVGGVMALLLASLLLGVTAWERIYNGRVLWLEPWSASSTANHSGLVSSLVMFDLHFGHGKKKPDMALASGLIADYSQPLRQQLLQPSTPTAELPDIVVVQSESFFDPSIMKGYEDSRFTPNLHRLARQGTSGELHVPTFGGGTIRTEFEVLTGLSLRYFDDLQFPYLQLSHRNVPGLVRVLNAHGYDTVALHGNDPAFWNRSAAFEALGFDRFVSVSSFPPDAPMDGKYMADSAMTDEILRQLKDNGPPQFLFAISIEAHGPYDVEPADVAERDAIPVPAGIEGRDKLELQTYLYHARHADAELGRLVRELALRARPSLVLFYGDHLPALSNSYQITGFVDGRDMLSQAGTYLLIEPKHPAAPVRKDTASWLLPAALLNAAGIHGDPYFALTDLVGPALAALTEAPGAAAPAEGEDLRKLDQAMSSIDQLRMNGGLDKLLPATGGTDAGAIAHEPAPPLPPRTAAALQH